MSLRIPDPRYIAYLLQDHPDFDCYLLVGNGEMDSPVERIGVEKRLLMAHSRVFRKNCARLSSKDIIEIKDISPGTFKNFLRNIYGFNNTSSLTFDELDDLLYAAEKYRVSELKERLATQLWTLLSSENICSLMNNPACYQELKLNQKITEILQFETRKVLASYPFLSMSPVAFLVILKQEKLQVAEIELWRSAVQWAQYRTNSDDGLELRKELKTLLPHIRVCTVSHEDFCQEIAPTKVLTYSEIVQICLYFINNDHGPALTYISDITQPRINL